MAESGGSFRPLTLKRVLFCRSGLWLLLRKQPRLSVAVSVTGPDFWAQFRLHSSFNNLTSPSLPTLCHRLRPCGAWRVVIPLLPVLNSLPSFIIILFFIILLFIYYFFLVWVGGSVALLAHPSVLSWPCSPLLHEVCPF